MNGKITFRAEIEFQGSADDLAKMLKTIDKLPVRVIIDKIPLPFPFPGGWPIPPVKILPRDILPKIVKANPVLSRDIPGRIDGGIRDPHLHVDDQLVMLGREEFGQVVGMAAESIARELAAGADYQQTVGALRELNRVATAG
ncbi:MAG: hypothetical protein L3J03_12235 [Desulfobacterales bacterium]|nr:hypothetical protein [Desulfobacterales bacterium]